MAEGEGGLGEVEAKDDLGGEVAKGFAPGIELLPEVGNGGDGGFVDVAGLGPQEKHGDGGIRERAASVREGGGRALLLIGGTGIVADFMQRACAKLQAQACDQVVQYEGGAVAQEEQARHGSAEAGRELGQIIRHRNPGS